MAEPKEHAAEAQQTFFRITDNIPEETWNRFQKWTSALKGMARRWRATGKAIAASPITGRHVNL